MRVFALFLLAACVTLSTAIEESPITHENNTAHRELKGGKKKGKATTTVRPTTTPRPTTPPPPTPYASAQCFKHHGCGLDGKRGERDRGISPIIPGITKHECCKKGKGRPKGMGSAWGTGPDDCQNCN